MNPDKLNHRQQQRTGTDHQEQFRAETAREFGTPEELLRHDAAEVVPPPGIEARLGDSIRRESPASPWWKRIFGR